MLMGGMMKKIFLFLTVLFILTGCNNQEYYSKNLFYMDTVINIKIYDDNKEKVNKAFEEIENLYQKYENITNFYDENSELYTVNNNNTDNEYIYLSNELADLINLGLDWYYKSDGLLNINIGNLTKIWHDFRENPTSLPSDLNDIVIDINQIKLEGNKLLNNNPSIDLGCLVKGYVTQLAGQYLEDNGLEYYLINAGGNVKAGKSHKGHYNIGIASPINSNETFEIIKGENISVVTSGGYERFVEYDGVLYHHIIDPNTKYPANFVKSVTVIGKDSGQCDALSTILFLMDVETGKEFIKDYDVEVIWFTNENEIIKSDGFSYE